ncbi:LacI family DNA-binding transcriptional regulator [Arthrobacter bambusae]
MRERPDARPALEHDQDRKFNATIYDIAKTAGVNPSTVSRALNKPERVSTKRDGSSRLRPSS